jgi:arsenate reductase-like glutaredoxin family protein
MTQEQMFWKAHRQIADANETFMQLVKDGMTREELKKNIEKRPELWGRFSNWLEKLPTETNKEITKAHEIWAELVSEKHRRYDEMSVL